ncbi:hypothetical protein C3F09_11060 [candidate division GN15 bacterium]|uniref:TonB C-terminal domain-containing protein n=1 Tax=candidate division GN15 bacterium TaxID=2072418 RepID=A0A855X3K6_9BACT|nr:MAG: hypothetical protein C3F09_11060 [candidate division GN15 bacterium]
MNICESTNRRVLAAFLTVLLVCPSVIAGGKDKPRSDLPKEIESLSEEARPEPARSVLDFDSASAAIADSAKAVVWLEFRLRPSEAVSEIQVVYSSHPGFGLEARAIEALKAVSFDPSPRYRNRLPKRVYHEVVFDHAQFGSLIQFLQKPVSATDSLVVVDSTITDDPCTQAPLPDEFIAVEVIPEMIEYARPEYPREAKVGNITGTVWVKSLIDCEGRVRKVIVAKSSGSALLDQSAVESAYRCRFKPGIQGGRPVPCWATYRVDYSIEIE